jgi:hypothetical protein
MIAMDSRPVLRRLDTFVVQDPERGRMLVLRDMEGVSEGVACIPLQLVPIVARFTGDLTVGEIAQAVSADLHQTVATSLVVRLAEALDGALLLDGPAFRAALDDVRRQFHEAATRPATHAGGGYPGERGELGQFLEGACLAHAHPEAAGDALGSVCGVIAPHIDPRRGAVGYGHAYSILRHRMPIEADTFVVFGTSHAPMREPFALCRKGFETPLGTLPADVDAIDRLAAACSYDPYTDELNHKAEHSIEFQAVFLAHILGGRPARIVPILAGLGRQQARKLDPATDARAMELLNAVRALVEERGRRVVVVAGADLAHVGPRFGDPAGPGVEEREALRRKDVRSLELAVGGDAADFWADVVGDCDTRRVCGFAAIYALLRTVRAGVKGRVLHYEQTLDPDEGSVVTHAAAAFFG